MIPYQKVVAGDSSIKSYVPNVAPQMSKQKYSSGWVICNKSNESTVDVAYSYYDGNTWVKKGWRNIKKNKCSQIISALNTQYVYYYAEGVSGGRWTGNINLCTHPSKKFTFKGNRCPSNYQLYGYNKVDTGKNSLYTTRLTE